MTETHLDIAFYEFIAHFNVQIGTRYKSHVCRADSRSKSAEIFNGKCGRLAQLIQWRVMSMQRFMGISQSVSEPHHSTNMQMHTSAWRLWRSGTQNHHTSHQYPLYQLNSINHDYSLRNSLSARYILILPLICDWQSTFYSFMWMDGVKLALDFHVLCIFLHLILLFSVATTIMAFGSSEWKDPMA